MPVNDEIGKRMKEYYEKIPVTKLMRRCPVVIRIDGKAFHTFTRGLMRPFDDVLISSMQGTTKYLCENIQGCVLGYTQSDEISLVLVDYENFETNAWFDYEVQKLCSISASMATMTFNRLFRDFSVDMRYGLRKVLGADYKLGINGEDSVGKYRDALIRAGNMGAMFDSRVFSIPKEEVTNYIYWRQLDASRNSIQMVGQAVFSHKQLHGKSCNQIQDMLMVEKGINWNDYPTYQKRGSCCIKETYSKDGVERSRWIVDTDIPIFKGEDREYIEKLIRVGE